MSDSSYNPLNWFKSSAPPPLLPAPTIDAFGRESRTLVLGLEDTLVHFDWNRMDGWRDHIRSDLHNVLENAVKNNWEIVLFSSKPQLEYQDYVQGPHAKLDPYGFIKHKLWHEQTDSANLNFCKNLERLNRDLSRVVVVDWNKQSYCNHQENVITIDRFDSTAKVTDHKLSEIGHILKKMNEYNTHDVRPYIASYNAEPKTNLFAREEELEKEAAQEWQSIGGGNVIKTPTPSANKGWSLISIFSRLGLNSKGSFGSGSADNRIR
jgi:import inner membrane translocase subunit TIM50